MVDIDQFLGTMDKLSNSSSKVQLANGETERLKFILYLDRTYPAAKKDTKSWLRFIKNTTGVGKEWNCVY